MIVRCEYRDLDTRTGPMRTYIYTPASAKGEEKFPGLLLDPEIVVRQHRPRRLMIVIDLRRHDDVSVTGELHRQPYDRAGLLKESVERR